MNYDGQYHLLSVPELLDGHFGFTGANRKFSDWDPMHIAVLEMQQLEKKLSSVGSFKLRKISAIFFKAINWGQEFEHFLKSDDETFDADVFRGLPYVSQRD